MPVDPEGLPTIVYREYRYRSLFGLSHEQYENEPAVTVDWMLAIDGAVSRAEAEQQRPTDTATPGRVGRVATRPL